MAAVIEGDQPSRGTFYAPALLLSINTYNGLKGRAGGQEVEASTIPNGHTQGFSVHNNQNTTVMK